MTTLDEVGLFLQAAAVGTLSVDLFLGEMPEDPIECGAIMETPGLVGLDTMGVPALPPSERPSLQFLARSETTQAARVRAELAYQALTQVQNQALSGTTWQRVMPNQPPFLIGRDGMGHYLYSVNFSVWKAVS